jgi:hypothetical protein
MSDRNKLREERLILPIVSEVSINHGREGKAKQLTSWCARSRTIAGRDWARYNPQRHVPETYFFQLDTRFYSGIAQ